MTRKFYRTIVHFEVLSEDAPVGDDVSLETIAPSATRAIGPVASWTILRRN